MNSDRWLSCDNALDMVRAVSFDVLSTRPQVRISRRKAYKVACAWIRRIWCLLNASSTEVVAMIECDHEDKFSYISLIAGDQSKAYSRVTDREHISDYARARWIAGDAVADLFTSLGPYPNLGRIQESVTRALSYHHFGNYDSESQYAANVQNLLCHDLRDILGNPYDQVVFPPDPGCKVCRGEGSYLVGIDQPSIQTALSAQQFKVIVHCGCCRWFTPDLMRIAENIYDNRHWQECPILVDPLIEAGCNNEALLQSLRGFERCWLCEATDGRENDYCSVCASVSPRAGWVPMLQPHVLGYWAVDRILSKGYPCT